METQRAEAQAAIIVINGIQVASLLAAVLKNSPIEGELPLPGCQNGAETTFQQISPSRWKLTVDAFYDRACTTLLSHAVLNTTALSVATFAIAGNATTYTRAGKAVAFAKITNKTDLGSSQHSDTQGTIALSKSVYVRGAKSHLA